jgi:hypothetical protein
MIFPKKIINFLYHLMFVTQCLRDQTLFKLSKLESITFYLKIVKKVGSHSQNKNLELKLWPFECLGVKISK